MELKLDMPEGILELDIPVAEGPRRLTLLAFGLLRICDAVTAMGSDIAADFKKKVTCSKGCGVCCSQLVPLSPPEAGIIADVVDSLPGPRKQEVLDNFTSSIVRIEQAGMTEEIRGLYSCGFNKDTVMEINRRYFNLNMPCPFLAGGSCGIYGSRPSRCREYSVMSPSQFCADPFDPRVKRLPVTLKLSEALAQAWAALTGTKAVLVPMVFSLEWVNDNPRARYCTVEGGGKFVAAVAEYACRAANRRAREKMDAVKEQKNSSESSAGRL